MLNSLATVILNTDTVKWGSIEQFSMFFLNKIDCLVLDHMAPILNQYSLTFPDAKMTVSLGMRFCQINTTKVVQSHPIKMGQLWTKRDFVAGKNYSNFSDQICNQLWLWHKSNIQWFLPHHLWTNREKLTFDQSFVSKTSTNQIFFIRELSIRQGKKVKGPGVIYKISEVGSRNLQWPI